MGKTEKKNWFTNTYHGSHLSYSIFAFALRLGNQSRTQTAYPVEQETCRIERLGANHSNENILINTLTLQEAKESSEVENIVTTNDELYRADLNLKGFTVNASAKKC